MKPIGRYAYGCRCPCLGAASECSKLVASKLWSDPIQSSPQKWSNAGATCRTYATRAMGHQALRRSAYATTRSEATAGRAVFELGLC
ncbi:hypothetical protein E2562_032444 [Oryza meyeriana var. granulata]|uniref:Uncharacterized protein n=1 Tax=Oryza meyeriana var. granulata TaxID=110450 RepID=A0A6G1E5C2_9ORYZ|nr:hypothetical protein E2562_032444 [Oryza meyeriana var. granulata]